MGDLDGASHGFSAIISATSDGDVWMAIAFDCESTAAVGTTVDFSTSGLLVEEDEPPVCNNESRAFTAAAAAACGPGLEAVASFSFPVRKSPNTGRDFELLEILLLSRLLP